MGDERERVGERGGKREINGETQREGKGKRDLWSMDAGLNATEAVVEVPKLP